MKWICATVAPWAMAGGVLISFTAAAGNDPRAGVSATGRTAAHVLIDAAALVPPTDAVTLNPVMPGLNLARAMPQGMIRLDDPTEAEDGASILRSELKPEAPALPDVERAAKGDPTRPLAPSLSRRAGDVRHTFATSRSRLMFGRDERVLPPTILMPGAIEGPDLDEQTFEPWQNPDVTTTKETSSVQSPAAAAAGSTGAARGSTTPSVGRAMALSSTTPAPADAVPVEIAAAPVSGPQSPRLDLGPPRIDVPVDPTRPRYADLIDPDKVDREQRCLAEAVYFEARSEPEEGQAAVAQVVLNRVKSGLYPGSICGVVYQNRHRHLACQFTFACEGKSLRIGDRESWDQAQRVAREVLEGKTYLADVGSSTHYHADYVRPRWARKLKKMDVIGRHIFYKLRPGQT